jgi:argininosuccinate lyase
MPQKRNPVALEHARAISSKALGQAAAITTTVHNTPFGDIVDTEDDLQPLVASMFRDALRAVTLVAASMRGAAFDVARLEALAAVGGTTATELADHLVRRHDLPFSKAHAVAARLVAERRARPDAPLAASLAQVCVELLGRPLPCSDEEIETVLSPRHFVEVRTTLGGPAPAETSRALDLARQALEADRTWLAGARGALAEADGRRQARMAAL